MAGSPVGVDQEDKLLQKQLGVEMGPLMIQYFKVIR